MAIDPVYLVRGNQRPYITLTLTRTDGTVIDLSDVNTSVVLRFRSVASESTLQTIACGKVDGGALGKVQFNFPPGSLDGEPGWYEGEIEITFNTQKQTVYDRIKFFVRNQFS